MGIKVGAAGDVGDARKLIRAEVPPYDIVLTDLKLPGGSGMDIVRAAQECNRDSLVSIVTGFGSLETAIEAIRLGAYDYITKPFALDEIGVQVRNMIERVSLAKENSRLALRLQELYSQIDRLQSERQDLAGFQEELRRELAENRAKLDEVLAAVQGRQAGPNAPDRIGISGLLLDLDRLDCLRSAGTYSTKELDDKRRGLIEQFVQKM
jgi:DNA-binding NtrC family response regulator